MFYEGDDLKEYNNNKEIKKDVKIYPDISVDNHIRCPETAEEMVNSYGTYNIQPTADTDNDFPAIAQGATPEMEKRTQEFFRDGDDFNPASDMSPDDCF